MTSPIPPHDWPEEARWLADHVSHQHRDWLIARTTKLPRWRRLLSWAFKPFITASLLILANHKELHGSHYLPPELEAHSKLTARSLSAASLLNAITNHPLLLFAFIDMGVIPGWSASLLLNLIIIKFTNDCGTALAGRRMHNRLWATAGAIGLVGMSLLQSSAAAIGIEALLNGPELSRIKSAQLIEDHEINLAQIQVNTDTIAPIQAEYDRVYQEWQMMDREHPNWNALYERLFGTWGEKDRDWSTVPTESRPLEQQLKQAHDDAEEHKQAMIAAWNEKLVVRQTLGNDPLFLQQEMPNLFNQHFEPDFQLKSGIETIRLATLNLMEKVTIGDIAGVGFPVFFLLLSMITSTAACLMTLGHALREDTRMSRDEVVGQAISTYLDQLRRHADDGEEDWLR
jgi:hypothetical protein